MTRICLFLLVIVECVLGMRNRVASWYGQSLFTQQESLFEIPQLSQTAEYFTVTLFVYTFGSKNGVENSLDDIGVCMQYGASPYIDDASRITDANLSSICPTVGGHKTLSNEREGQNQQSPPVETVYNKDSREIEVVVQYPWTSKSWYALVFMRLNPEEDRYFYEYGFNLHLDVEDMMHTLDPPLPNCWVGETVLVDGSQGSSTNKALQIFLNANGASVQIDGYYGTDTVQAFQVFLNENGAFPSLSVDGIEGKSTVSAIQTYLNKFGFSLWVDGVSGRVTISALQRFLNGNQCAQMRLLTLPDNGSTKSSWNASDTFYAKLSVSREASHLALDIHVESDCQQKEFSAFLRHDGLPNGDISVHDYALNSTNDEVHFRVFHVMEGVWFVAVKLDESCFENGSQTAYAISFDTSTEYCPSGTTGFGCGQEVINLDYFHRSNIKDEFSPSWEYGANIAGLSRTEYRFFKFSVDSVMSGLPMKLTFACDSNCKAFEDSLYITTNIGAPTNITPSNALRWPQTFDIVKEYTEDELSFVCYVNFPQEGIWYIGLADNPMTDWGEMDKLEEDDCTTIGGPDSGSPCMFPFKYKSRVYAGCTTDDSGDGSLWCATKVDEWGNMPPGSWGYCSNTCTLLDPPIYTLKIETDVCFHGCSDHGLCSMDRVGNKLGRVCECEYGWGGDSCSQKWLPSSPGFEIANIILVISNAAMIPVVVRTLKKGFYTEAMILASSSIVSAFYHACNVYLYCLLDFWTLHDLDFTWAFLAVGVIIVFMSDLRGDSRHAVYFLLILLLAALSDFPMDDGVKSLIVGGTAVAFLLFDVGKKVHKKRKREKSSFWRSFVQFFREMWSWKYLTIGFIALAGAVVCKFYYFGDENYFIVHSLWHFFIMIAAYLFVCAKKKYSKSSDKLQPLLNVAGENTTSPINFEKVHRSSGISNRKRSSSWPPDSDTGSNGSFDEEKDTPFTGGVHSLAGEGYGIQQRGKKGLFSDCIPSTLSKRSLVMEDYRELPG